VSSSTEIKLKATLTKSKTGWYFLDVPTKIARRFETDPKTRRVVCTLNGSHTFQCALSPNGKGDYCIGVSMTIRKKLGLEAGDVVAIELRPDTSKYGAPMPEEFAEVLKQDPEGDKLFHALTSGMRRSLIYLVASTKNVDKRIHFALLVLEHLKENNGKVKGALLFEEIKRPLF